MSETTESAAPTKPPLKTVLVLSASVGAGHVRAGQAVEKAARQAGLAETVEHIDTLDHTNKLFRKLYSKLYLDMVGSMPTLLGWFYDYLDQPWQKQRRRLLLDKLNTRRFVEMLKERQPEWVVCTHFLPAEIIAWQKRKGNLPDTKLAVVVTDFDVHAMWLYREADRYFVPLEETRLHLQTLGIEPHRITATGIPIDPLFAREEDPRKARLELGLNPERTTLLISAGGFGVGPVEHMMESLLELKHPVQVAAVCGRSEPLKAKLEKLAAEKFADCHVSVKVVGYTTEMHKYMTAADLLLGKPGGLTTSEALAKGLVMVIVNPIPGQEERNADHLLEEGVAIRCNNLPVLAYKIDRLLSDEDRLRRMKDKVKQLARPEAAADLVRRLTGD